MSEELQEVQEKSSKSINIQQFVLSALATIVIPAFLAFWTSKVFNVWYEDNEVLWGGIFCILLALQLTLALVIVLQKNWTQATYFEAKKLQDKIIDLKNDNEALSLTTKYGYLLLRITSSWILLENTFLKTCQSSEDISEEQRKNFYDNMFAPLIRYGDDLFSFKHAELWNFAIYQYDKTRKILCPIWRSTSEHHPSSQCLGREWHPNNGHVGIAFVKKEDLITSDASKKEIKTLAQAARDFKKDYDDDVYQSFAAIPIMHGEDEPVGIVVATSNIPGRFNTTNSQVLKIAANVLYNIIYEIR